MFLTTKKSMKLALSILLIVLIGGISVSFAEENNKNDKQNIRTKLKETIKKEFQQKTKSETLAINATKNWLALVDVEKYPESWEQASQLFKGAVSKGQWEKAIKRARKPLGKNIFRKLKLKRFHTSLPGAPDGEYFVIQFNASFKNKKNAIETITLMMDKDRKWRVSGYFIK